MSNHRGSGGSAAMRKLAQALSGTDVPCTNKVAGPLVTKVHHRCPACGTLVLPFKNGKLRPHTAPNNVVG